jgi:hypothetical protein
MVWCDPKGERMRYLLALALLAGCSSTQDLQDRITARRAQMTPDERLQACEAAKVQLQTSCVYRGPVNSDCEYAQALVSGFCY